MIAENEKVIENLKSIEGYLDLLLETITNINHKATQSRQLLEIQTRDTKQSQIIPEQPKTKPKTHTHSFVGGPWSNALREKYMKAQREKHGIKMREGYE